MKPRKVKVFLEYDNPQRGGYYDPNTGEIGLNLAEINDAAAALHFMEHELRHAGLEELSNPSLRTYTAESVYNDSITPARNRVRYLYGDRDAAFLGEELYAEMPANIDTTNGTIHNAILDIYGQNNTGQTAQQVQAALEFFSQNASEGTFATVAKDAILSSKQHVDLFTAGNAVSIDNPLAAKMVADYQSLTDIAGVPRNKETLGVYLDELLDPTTELNVFKRQSVVC